MKNNIKVHSSKKPAEDAGDYLSGLFATAGDKPVLLLLAGGSSFDVLNFIDPNSLGSNITVTVTDEIYTDDVGDSNFGTLQILPFYDALINVDALCIDTQILASESFEENTERFNRNLVEWKKDFPRGVVISLIGVGDDGSVAGIIPGILSDKDFDEKFNGKEMAAGMDCGDKNKHQFRVSTTLNFLRDSVDQALVYMVGENKNNSLKNISAEAGDIHVTPSRIFNEMKSVIVFTDIE